MEEGGAWAVVGADGQKWGMKNHGVSIALPFLCHLSRLHSDNKGGLRKKGQVTLIAWFRQALR